MNAAERNFQNTLAGFLHLMAEAGHSDWDFVKRVDTFEEDGIMSSNAGVVVKLEDGVEFQLTIVQSAGPSTEEDEEDEEDEE